MFVDPTGNISCSKLGTEPCINSGKGRGQHDGSDYVDYVPFFQRTPGVVHEQPALYDYYDNMQNILYTHEQNAMRVATGRVPYWLMQYAYEQAGDLTSEQRTNAATAYHDLYGGSSQPNLPKEPNTPDGISIFAYAPDAHIALNISAVAGFEYLYNLHTGDKTLFFVGGVSGSFTIGALVDNFSFNKVYNIGTNNLLYKGNFNSASLSGALLLGGGLGYGWTPGDFLGKSDPYSVSFIPACGPGGISVNGNITEYIPLYTIDKNGFITPHTLEYYETARGGYVTSIVQTMDRLLTNEVQKYDE